VVDGRFRGVTRDGKREWQQGLVPATHRFVQTRFR
jgi:hypothetical protein